VVRHICHRVAVMYLGKLVEIGDCDTLFEDPRHPYTQALLSAVPVPDPVVERARPHRIIKGEIPSPINPPAGCVFHPRCSLADDGCTAGFPELQQLSAGHRAACFKLDQTAMEFA